jgi:hypothetical protein
LLAAQHLDHILATTEKDAYRAQQATKRHNTYSPTSLTGQNTEPVPPKI